MSEIIVSEWAADFFYEQCAGEHSGHMTRIPNNPVLQGFLLAHNVKSKAEFAQFLEQAAIHLKIKLF